MNFEEKDVELCIDGMGIVFYSPENAMHIPEGNDFLNRFADDIYVYAKN